MRKHDRSPAPEVLRNHGARWTQQWMELRRRNPGAQFQWYEVDGRDAREWLLPDLKAMTQGHCAFCDTFPLEDRTLESIEHFKPKADQRFEAHAYDWTNLYFCCGLCQSEKGVSWDDDLLRPDHENYRFDAYFQFDYTNGAMTPSSLATEQAINQAKATIKAYGLDIQERRRMRQLELRKWQKSSDRDIDEWAYRDYLQNDAGDNSVS